jgi:DNA repair exonuclease SbcCD ATPase subunit
VTNDLVNLGKKKSVIDILKKAFSSNGLIAYKIEVMVKDLEVLTNQYLSEISDGRFVLIFKVESDKLNVVICDNGTDIDISALSNGEKSKVNTATLLAIRKLMNSLSSSKVNLLILDETIENLDVDSKERLIEVLLNEPHLNTFLVSHSYSHPLVSKLVATKEDNISKLEEF